MGLLDDAIKEHLDLQRRRGADPAEVERAEREALGPVRRTPTAQDAEEAGGPQAENGFAYDHPDEESGSEDGLGGVARPIRSGRDLESEFEAEFADEPPEAELEPRRPSRPSRLARIFGRADREPEPDPELGYDEPAETEPPRRGLSEPHEPGFDDPSERSFDDPPHDQPTEVHRPPPARAPVDPGEEPEAFHAPRPAVPPRAAPTAGVGPETEQHDVEPALGATGPAPPEIADEDVLEETPEFLQDTPDHDRLWFEQRPPRDFDFDG